MSKFCTGCGQPKLPETEFCTSCGKRFTDGGVKATSLSAHQSVDFTVETTSATPEKATKVSRIRVPGPLWARITLSAVAVVLVGIAGAVIARSSVDTEQIRMQGYDDGVVDGKSVGYDSGFQAGKSAGDQEGYQRGYGEGMRQGCLKAFDFSDISADYVVAYDPYSYVRYPGSHYKSKSDC